MLNLVGDAFRLHNLHYVCRGGGEEGEDGEGAVFLVLLEPTSQATKEMGVSLFLSVRLTIISRRDGGMESLLLFGSAVAAHTLARITDFGDDILSDNVASSDDAGTNRDWGPIVPQPSARRREHGQEG